MLPNEPSGGSLKPTDVRHAIRAMNRLYAYAKVLPTDQAEQADQVLRELTLLIKEETTKRRRTET